MELGRRHTHTTHPHTHTHTHTNTHRHREAHTARPRQKLSFFKHELEICGIIMNP